MHGQNTFHFGRAWEQQIGTIHHILDAMFAELGSARLPHKLLMTLMAEVTVIVNTRPIALVPTDIDKPQPLLPSMLLTMKAHPAGHHLESFLELTCTPAVFGGGHNTSLTNSGYDGGRNTYRTRSPEENGHHPDKT